MQTLISLFLSCTEKQCMDLYSVKKMSEDTEKVNFPSFSLQLLYPKSRKYVYT